ncbi:MAG: GGDEF domain-containing protein [Pseudobutyrivibrio sp.]|nr:GGDEF domain-containing protein [Pseudobutyrivibrio sp.]
MQRISTKKITIFILILFVALLLLQLIYVAKIHIEKIANHNKLDTILSKDLAYSWDTMDEQLVALEDIARHDQLFKDDAGMLYERTALIYLQKGDNISYYKNLGYALYYLNGSDDDVAVNIYLDLANFYLNNYSSTYAQEMLDKAYAIKPIEDITNPQIKSYAYRMQGIMHIMKYNYNEAETAIMNSQRVLEKYPNEVYTTSYMAMNDVWLARIYEETGRLAKCKEKLDKWADSDMFTTKIYRTIYLRDFIIPYYQAKCYYLCAENIKEYNNIASMDSGAKEQAVINFLHEFMDLCEANNYEKAELYTITKVQKEYPTRNETIQKELNFVLNRLNTTLFNQQNYTIASVVNDVVSDATNELQDAGVEKKQRLTNSLLRTFLWFIGISTLAFLLVMVSNSRFDTLSGLLNRNMFNYNLVKIKSSKAKYGIIMLDIDDFKKINDNYGHLKDDIVLRRLGQIISKETTPDIKAYRYGGEEFVLTVERADLAYIKAVAGRIRKHMEE